MQLDFFPSRTITLYIGRMFAVRIIAVLLMLVLVLQMLDLLSESGRILAAPEIDMPNGLAVSPVDKTFYLIEADGRAGKSRNIRAYDLQPDGSVTNMRVVINFAPGRSVLMTLFKFGKFRLRGLRVG